MSKEKQKFKEKPEKEKLIVSTRGRTFQGRVVKKFPKRVVIEFERTVYVPKYQRFFRKKTRLHARIPENMQIEIGDIIRIKECRPLSKIIHFIVIEKLKSLDSKNTRSVKI